MAEFLTTNGITYCIEKIIVSAEAKLVLISPYLQISKTFYERLKDASKKGIRIEIIYGKDELNPNERSLLSTIKNLTLYYFENLHAKCYFNESEMVITSMNMYEFSEKNNREMGVYISATKDPMLYKKAVQEADSIKESSNLISQFKQTVDLNVTEIRKSTNTITPKNLKGFCIKCVNKIPYNPENPYCKYCYKDWINYNMLEMAETFCHCCGKDFESSKNDPLCDTCSNTN